MKRYRVSITVEVEAYSTHDAIETAEDRLSADRLARLFSEYDEYVPDTGIQYQITRG